MPTLLDLTAIEPASLPVQDQTGRTWTLRDTVPAETMLRGFALMELDERVVFLRMDAQTPYTPDVPLSDPPTPEELRALMEAQRAHQAALRTAMQEAYVERLALVTELALACFQASYPDVDERRLTRDILPSESTRRRVVDYFFGLHLFGWNAVSSASSAAAAATPSAAQPEQVDHQVDHEDASTPVAAPPTPTPPSGKTTTTRTPSTTSRAPMAATRGKTATRPPAPASSASRRPTSTRPTATGSRATPKTPKPTAKPQPLALRAVPKPPPRPTLPTSRVQEA